MLWLAATIIAALAYAALLYAHAVGLFLAPLVAGLVVGALCSRPKGAFAAGALGGLLGYLLVLYTVGAGLQAVSIIAGIGGPGVAVLSIAYHVLAPGLAGYLAWWVVRRFRG